MNNTVAIKTNELTTMDKAFCMGGDRIAAYVAGDENIVYPGIMTLVSVKEQNDLDLFLFTEMSKLTQHQISLIQEYNIAAVDVSELRTKANLDGFDGFHRWPVHVFYNYVAPIYLQERNYAYAIKLDYDMLCMARYDLQEILPSSEETISIVYKRKLSEFVSEKIFTEKSGLSIKLEGYHSVTAGFFVANTQSFVDKKFFDVYRTICLALQKTEYASYISGETIEQFTLGVAQSMLGHSFRKIHPGYNFRPYYFKQFDKNYNIHFNKIKEKPWQDVPKDAFVGKGAIGWLRSFLFFNYWIDFANEHGLKDIIKRDRYSAFDFSLAVDSCIEYLEKKNKNQPKMEKRKISKSLFELLNIFK